MHLQHVAFYVRDHIRAVDLLREVEVSKLNDIVGEFPRLKVEHVDVALLHSYEYVPMILLLARYEGWYVQAADLARLWIGLWHLYLHFAIVEVLHVPQLHHIGHINRDEKALVGHESHVTDFKIVGVKDFLFIAL